MKKFLYLALCVILTLAMTFSFVACGDDTEDDSTTTTTSTKKPTSGSSDTTGSSDGTTDSSDNTTDSSDNPGTDPDVPSHEHTFEDVLTYDDNEHYYKATCEHTEEKKGAAPHSHDKYTGACVCGHTVEVDMEAIIESILANRDKVVSGQIVNLSHDIGFNLKSTTTYEYAFYENYLYIKEVGDYTNEYYYTLDKNGAVFGVMVQGDFVNRDTEAYEDSLLGPKFNYQFMGDYDNYEYGVETFVNALYTMGKDFDSFFAGSVEGKPTFAFGVMGVESTDYYVIAVSFSVNAETETIEACAIICQRYSESDYTEVDGVIVLNENAEANYVTTITIAQSTADIDEEENPYDPNEVLVDSFIVVDGNGKDIEENVIEIVAGDSIKLLFNNVAPETALLNLSNISLSVVNNADGSEADYWPYFNPYNNSYTFSLQKSGSYTLTVTVDDIEVVSTIEVALKNPTSISSQVYDSALSVFDKTSKVDVYAGASLYFMSYVEPDYNGAYKAELVSGAENATLTQGEIDGVAATVFTSNVVGTYQIKITSTVKTNLSCTLTVNVVEASSLDSILSGEYIGTDSYGTTPITVTFDSANKTAEIVFEDIFGKLTANISYTTANGFEYTVTSGDDFVEDFYISESYDLVLVIDGEKYVLEAVAKEIVATGTIAIEDIVNNGKNSGTYTFELYSNGKFAFYKDGIETTAIVIEDNGDSYSMKHPGLASAQPLIRVGGTDGELAGTYKIEMSLGSTMHMSNVTITVDATEEPVKESTTGTLVVDHLENNGKYSGTYTYEIVDGAFVFYKDGEVTTDVTLSGDDGVYTFKFQGIGSAVVLEKTSGDEGTLAGTYKCAIKLSNMSFHSANVTITPDPVDVGGDEPAGELTTGTLNIVDNNNGAVTGTYIYEIVNGAFVFYKDGAVTNNIIVTINLDGTYSFQSINLLVPQVLEKTEGDSGVLAGKYSVNSQIKDLFVLTFTPGEVEIPEEEVVTEPTTGTVTVVDNNNGAVSGTYTYAIVNGAFVIYKDGVETIDIIISVGLDGSYTFQCAGIAMPQTCVKVEGDSGVLAGKYNVVNGIYVLTFVPGATGEGGGDEGDDEPVDVMTELVVGDNSVVVSNGNTGVELPFTSEAVGKYKIEAAEGESNAFVVVIDAAGNAERVTLPYTFTLEAGASILFNICTNDRNSDTIDLVISEVEEEDEPVVTGAVVYQGTHAGSGRLYQITIDAEAGTMSVIRAAIAGNSLDTTRGAIECVFTYEFDGTTVKYELVSGSGCGEITFDANGAPATLRWSSHEVTSFTVVE